MVAGRPQRGDGLLERRQRLGDVAARPRGKAEEPGSRRRG